MAIKEPEERTQDDAATNENSQEDAEGDNKKREGDGGKSDRDKNPRSKLPIVIAAVLLVVAIVGGIIYYILTLGQVSTDDAYTDGNAVSIATNTSGFVTALFVNDNQFVHRGDLLLIVDPRSNRAQVEQAVANLQLAKANLIASQIDLQEEQVRAPAQLLQAKAQLSQADAQLDVATRNYRRQLSVDQRATAQSDIDQTSQQLVTARAQVQQAQANLAIAALVQQNIASATQQVVQRQAQLDQARANLDAARTQLSYNYIRAPQDGWIAMRNVDLGTYLAAGTQVFTLVASQIWVTANFKETQLNGMKIGQHVTISVDAFPALKLRGHVQSMQQGSGAVFTAFPAENATGNFVKIVRRVPVKILIDSGLPASLPILPLGISVIPTVHEP
jgi:membrane fusion protein (multidrug efflux system)